MRELLQMSLTGGVLIAVVFLARLLLQHRIHRSILLLLWGIVLLRLLVPVFVQTDWYTPIFPEEPAAQALQEQARPAAAPQPANRQEAVPARPAEPLSTSAYVPPAAQETQFPFNKEQVLFAIWLCGAVGLFAYFIISHFRNRRSYRFSVPVPKAVQVPEGLRVRMLDGLDAPLTYGLLRPTVLMPVEFPWDNAERVQHVLLHEQTHIRRHDLVTKLLYLLAVCVHWFNPLVWVMLFLASEDMEMRCDAVVIRRLGENKSRDYANTLLAAERAKLTNLLQAGFSYSSTAARLKAIVRGRVGWALSGAVGILLTLVFSLGFFTGKATAAVPVQLPRPAVSTTVTAQEYKAEKEYLPPVHKPYQPTELQTQEAPHPMADAQSIPESIVMNENSTSYLTIWSTEPVRFSLKNAEPLNGCLIETYLIEQTEYEQQWYCSVYAEFPGAMTLCYESELCSGEITVSVLNTVKENTVTGSDNWSVYNQVTVPTMPSVMDPYLGIPTPELPTVQIVVPEDPTPKIPWPQSPGLYP